MSDILIDVDDVLYPWSAIAHDLLDLAGLTNGKPICTWDLAESYGPPTTREAVWEVLDRPMLLRTLYMGRPIDGALAQLARLRGWGHRVHLVTARGTFGLNQEEIQALTREWVRTWGVPLDSLSFAKDKVNLMPFDYALDDRPSTIEAFYREAEWPCKAFLMDACHNQTATGMPRVYSVREFADQVVGGV